MVPLFHRAISSHSLTRPHYMSSMFQIERVRLASPAPAMIKNAQYLEHLVHSVLPRPRIYKTCLLPHHRHSSPASASNMPLPLPVWISCFQARQPPHTASRHRVPLIHLAHRACVRRLSSRIAPYNDGTVTYHGMSVREERLECK
jgi:hypothetical protein